MSGLHNTLKNDLPTFFPSSHQGIVDFQNRIPERLAWKLLQLPLLGFLPSVCVREVLNYEDGLPLHCSRSFEAYPGGSVQWSTAHHIIKEFD